MTQNTADTFLICPFSGRNLRYLTDAELVVVNSRINGGELFFYPGVQVKESLKRALVTEHQTYIYPVDDNIIYLKKETAIVTKNRTKNYLKRVSDTVISSFESIYSFNRKTDSEQVNKLPSVPSMPSDAIASLKQYITKSQNVFVSMCSNNADDVHNLVFNTHFAEYVHADFDLERLKALKSELKKDTTLVLCDPVALPFAQESIDTLVSFDLINEYEKDVEKEAAGEIKRVVCSRGASIVMFNDSLPLNAERQLKKDELVKKAKVLMKPWKKVSSCEIYFHPISATQDSDMSDTFVGKTSLKRQLF
ncbi:methyltransferase domain-containing protein [Roseivirga sp.]|uniref:methyltransferase domain-containing protein n=1 Tax=Roseivirga sp. TaxID=1964215 RepID=UPI003B8BA10A